MFESARRYYLYSQPVDMRKGFDSLCGLVRHQMGLEIEEHVGYIFINKRATHMKMLFWEGDGVPDFFQSHMVLQRDTTISIFGTANRDEEIEVVFDGKIQKATTDSHGGWKVNFPAYPAGGPYTIRISGKQEEIILEDVWLGDVYLCSGQSNMVFSLN